MVSLFQRLSRSGALTSACLLVHCCFPFFGALSVVMTSRALAPVKKVIRTVLHAYVVHLLNFILFMGPMENGAVIARNLLVRPTHV